MSAAEGREDMIIYNPFMILTVHDCAYYIIRGKIRQKDVAFSYP